MLGLQELMETPFHGLPWTVALPGMDFYLGLVLSIAARTSSDQGGHL